MRNVVPYWSSMQTIMVISEPWILDSSWDRKCEIEENRLVGAYPLWKDAVRGRLSALTANHQCTHCKPLRFGWPNLSGKNQHTPAYVGDELPREFEFDLRWTSDCWMHILGWYFMFSVHVLTVQLFSSLISCVSWGVKQCRLIYKELSGRELGMHAG